MESPDSSLQSSQLYCSECGQAVATDSMFCSRCGAGIVRAVHVPASATATCADSNKEPSPRPVKAASKSFLMWIAVIMGCLFVALFVYSFGLGFVGSFLATTSRPHYQCEVCVTFNGSTICRNGAGASREYAERVALDLACTDFGGGMTSFTRCEQNAPRQVTWGPKSNQPLSPIYTLSADELFRAYNANGVAADMRYKGQVVVIVGRVQSIGKDIADQAYIVIGGEGFLDGVQCTFAGSENASVAQLIKGQNVTVKGEVSGKIGNVQVEKCQLQ